MAAITDKTIAGTATSIIAAADWKTLGSPVYIKNESDEIITITVSGADTMELDPGEILNILPGQIVTGTAVGGAALLQLYQGIIPSDESAAKGPGVSAADPLYVSGVNAMGTPAIKAQVPVGATTTAVLAANASRTHAIIKADAANTEALYLAIGESAVQDEGISLDPGETIQIGPDNLTLLVINGICTSGGMIANVWEA